MADVKTATKKVATKRRTKKTRALEFPAGVPEVSASQSSKEVKRLHGASLQRSLGSLRKSLDALLAGRFQEAVRRAVTAAVDAGVAFRQNPVAAVRIIRGARKVARRAVEHMRSITLQKRSMMPEAAPEAPAAVAAFGDDEWALWAESKAEFSSDEVFEAKKKIQMAIRSVRAGDDNEAFRALQEAKKLLEASNDPDAESVRKAVKIVSMSIYGGFHGMPSALANLSHHGPEQQQAMKKLSEAKKLVDAAEIAKSTYNTEVAVMKAREALFRAAEAMKTFPMISVRIQAEAKEILEEAREADPAGYAKSMSHQLPGITPGTQAKIIEEMMED